MARRVWVAVIASLAAFAVGHPGDGVVVDKNGDVYFVAMDPIEGPGHYAAVFKVTGRHEEKLVYKSQYQSSNLHLTLGLDGHLYIAERNYLGLRDGEDAFLTRIHRLARDGTTTLMHGERSGRRPYGGGAYLVDLDGTIVFADGKDLKRLSVNGKETTLTAIAGDKRIDKLAWGPDGEVYVLASTSVFVYETDGSTRELTSGLRDFPFKQEVMKGSTIKFDMAVAQDGRVFIADWNHRRVLEVSPNGVITTHLKSEFPWAPEGLAYRDGVLTVFESTGISDRGILPRIRTVDADGQFSTIYEFELDAPTKDRSSGRVTTSIFVVVFGIVVAAAYKVSTMRRRGSH
ncbi:MAG: hypothetical protein IH944_03615 [Armatimonadetes bacterium]|nr:hypothetical protein [Armatimonadota bacterium]